MSVTRTTAEPGAAPWPWPAQLYGQLFSASCPLPALNSPAWRYTSTGSPAPVEAEAGVSTRDEGDRRERERVSQTARRLKSVVLDDTIKSSM